MKKNLFIYAIFSLLLLFTLSLTACSDDLAGQAIGPSNYITGFYGAEWRCHGENIFYNDSSRTCASLNAWMGAAEISCQDKCGSYDGIVFYNLTNMCNMSAIYNYSSGYNIAYYQCQGDDMYSVMNNTCKTEADWYKVIYDKCNYEMCGVHSFRPIGECNAGIRELSTKSR